MLSWSWWSQRWSEWQARRKIDQTSHPSEYCHRCPFRVFETGDGEKKEKDGKMVARGAPKTRPWVQALIASRLQQRRWQWGRLKPWSRDPRPVSKFQNEMIIMIYARYDRERKYAGVHGFVRGREYLIKGKRAVGVEKKWGYPVSDCN